MKFHRTSIGRTFFLLSAGLIVLAGIFLQGVALYTVTEVKRQDTMNYLELLTRELEYAYELFDTDSMGFRIEDERLFVGASPIGEDYAILDRMKKDSDAELTLFCRDKRILTTLTDEQGYRYINTTASDIWEESVSKGSVFFGESVKINNEIYYAYYKPLKDSDGQVVGMAFAGISAETINSTISQMNQKIRDICLLVCILALLAAVFCTSRHQKKLLAIVDYLSEINHEKFDHAMPQRLTSRMDEYGDLSRHIERLNNSLQVLIQRDGLTMLLNRRTAMRRMELLCAKSKSGPLTFVLGDIDFFKKVNDTYGHACGDEVLKSVSQIMERNMEGLGFAARWGGEEFALVFASEISSAFEAVQKIAAEIRSSSVEFKEKTVQVTMTFGLAECAPPQDLEAAISRADERLYCGKNNGRNQVVCG